MKKLLLLTILLCSSLLCQAQKERIVLGDEQTSEYFPILKGKRIAIFSNHTGMVGDKHLLDILLENKFNVVAIFSPEHGFRGDEDAGEHVSSSVDKKTMDHQLDAGLVGNGTKKQQRFLSRQQQKLPLR